MFELSRLDFIELHDSIQQKHEKENKTKGLKVEKLYGFGVDNKSEEKSIRNSMIEKVDMKKVFKKSIEKFSGKYLYLKYKEAQKGGKNNIKLEQVYLDVFLAYLEVENFEHFKQKLSEKTTYTKYLLLHYSIKYYEIREAELLIDYSKTPFLVKEQGFHLNEQNNSNPVYEGKAERKKSYLYINLEGEDGDELKLILFVSHNPANQPKVFPFMQGVLMGVTNSGLHPISVECVLIRQENEIDLAMLENNKSYAERYLMLKRGNFRIPTDPPNSLKLLQAKNKSILEIEHMIGKYRAWSYSRRGDIEQAVFTIKSDYRAYLELDLTGKINKQACLLNLHSEVPQKLLVTSHAEGTINIYTYSIIDIPALYHKFTVGVFATVGVGERHAPIATYMVLCKEKENSIIVPQTIKKENFDKEININTDLRGLKEKLDKLMRENTIHWYNRRPDDAGWE